MDLSKKVLTGIELHFEHELPVFAHPNAGACLVPCVSVNL